MESDTRGRGSAPDAVPSRAVGDVAVIGASGGIGGALADALEGRAGARVFRLSRSAPEGGGPDGRHLALDLEDEATIATAAERLGDESAGLTHVIVAAGMLHRGEKLLPEKAWRDLDPGHMAAAFRVNATGPALVAKHFLPLLARDRRSVFAALSARVGSISDNRLGGWYSYRASKAALNMILKTLSVELARRNPQAICLALHPGTVDTALSKPFQGSARKRLFAPDEAARHLLAVIDGAGPDASGGFFAWDGEPIPY